MHTSPHTPPRPLAQAQLAERFILDDAHQLLLQQKGPHAALVMAHALQPCQLDAVVQACSGGWQYLEVSTSFASPDPARYAACAPLVLHAASHGGAGGLMIQSQGSGGSKGELASQYQSSLASYIQSSKGQPLGPRSSIRVFCRLSARWAPPPAAWVEQAWEVSAALQETLLARARQVLGLSS